MSRRPTQDLASRRPKSGGWARIVAWTLIVPTIAGAAMLPDGEEDIVSDESATRTGGETALGRLLDRAEDRTRAIESEAEELQAFYRTEMEPLVRGLLRLRDDSTHAKRIATALVREGLRAEIPPQLLLAVVTVENPWLEPGARSPVGAVGIMQVMPFHAGAWGCGGHDLTDVDVNVCHGTKILEHALERANGDLHRALLRYNGCVHGTNTPDCHMYPSWVMRNADPGWSDGWGDLTWVASATSSRALQD